MQKQPEIQKKDFIRYLHTDFHYNRGQCNFIRRRNESGFAKLNICIATN